MIRIKHRGTFEKTEMFLKKMTKADYFRVLDAYGRAGVQALIAATPQASGQTANSWGYEIVTQKGKVSIFWTNSNVNDGVNIAVILQYGHGTRNGGYVQGIDYINPAIVPIFENIANEAWKGVTTA